MNIRLPDGGHRTDAGQIREDMQRGQALLPRRLLQRMGLKGRQVPGVQRSMGRGRMFRGIRAGGGDAGGDGGVIVTAHRRVCTA